MVSRFARTIDTIPHPLPRELPFPKGALVKSLPLGGRVRLFLSFREAHNKKPSPRGAPVGGMSEGQGGSRFRRGEGGSAHAESDEGLTYPKDHLNKEYAALPRSSVNTQPHRIRYQKERLSPHPSPFGRHLPPEGKAIRMDA